MGNCRKQVLEGAFKLFLLHNMEKVTITELEKATTKIRGTIFYHFENKQKIFESVVDEIFLPLFDIPAEITDVVQYIAFKDFIGVYQSPEERVIHKMKTIFQVEEAEAGYYNFLNQAHKYYPSFKNKYSKIIDKELFVWNMVISRNKETNTLPNLPTKDLSYIFIMLSTGFFYNKGYRDALDVDYRTLLYDLARFA